MKKPLGKKKIPTICFLKSYISNCKATSPYTEATPSNTNSCKLHAEKIKKHWLLLSLSPLPALPTAWHLLMIFLCWVVLLLGSLGRVTALSSTLPKQRLLEVLGGKWKELFQRQRARSSWAGLCSLTLAKAGFVYSKDPFGKQPHR